MPPRSKIARLPAAVREKLDKRLIKSGFGDHQELSDWLESEGYEISRAAVQRHSQTFEQRVEQMRAATEEAKALIDATDDDHGALSDASLRLLQKTMWEQIVAGNIGDPRDVSTAANAMANVARASTNIQRDRRKILAEAADRAAAAGKTRGISPEFEKVLRAAIEGRPPVLGPA